MSQQSASKRTHNTDDKTLVYKAFQSLEHL